MASSSPNTTKPTTTPLITLLATTRIAFGSISLLAPSPTLQLFQVLPSPSSSPIGTALLPTRMFGIRDAVLGTLLYTAETPTAVRRALIAGAVVDGVDALSCLYGFLNGEIGGLAADLVGGGAVVFLLWGLWGLRGLGGLGGKGERGVVAGGGVAGK